MLGLTGGKSTYTGNKSWIMQKFFPILETSGYSVTSPATMEYNCIAWAAEDSKTWWWPDPFNQYYWPSGILREDTIDAFVKAFELFHYTICSDANYEIGYEKISIYAKRDGRPTHAARQISFEKWTSKIGKLEDIEHDINALSGDIYGEPVVFMKRPRK